MSVVYRVDAINQSIIFNIEPSVKLKTKRLKVNPNVHWWPRPRAQAAQRVVFFSPSSLFVLRDFSLRPSERERERFNKLLEKRLF